MSQALFDELRIWNRALTANEVKSHYKNIKTIKKGNSVTDAKNFNSNRPAYELPVLTNSKVSISLKSGAFNWTKNQTIPGKWQMGEQKSLTLNCNLKASKKQYKNISLKVDIKGNNLKPVGFNERFNSFVLPVEGLKRS